MHYGYAMIDEERPYEDEDGLGPSVALPPLYVLRATERCQHCGEAQHVYALGCASFHDAIDGFAIKIFHFLSRVRSVPAQLLGVLKTHCPGYYADHLEGEEPTCLLNHCRCGNVFGDDYLHVSFGAAFCPETPEGYLRIKLFQLPISEAVPIACSYTIGGGEYLDFSQAEVW
jgi:hypothetical protein